ncbi:MAG: hypothetical protein U0T33_07710 [Bacteroidales bacterium]
MKKYFIISALVLAFCIMFQGCKKVGDPPALPPAESMTIDFSNFVSTTKSAFVINDPKAVENTNWTVAATVASIWNTILVTKIAVPVASFAKAMQVSPTYLDNKTWQWSYSVTALAATYKARLTGQIISTGVKWEMYIAKEGAGSYTEFLWYEGTTALDGKSGTWTINESHENQNPMLQIDWTKDGTNVGMVKYTYVKDGESFKTSYIEYGLTSSTLNAYYTVYFWESTKLKFTTVNIEWSTSAFNGRVKAPDYFLDSNWYCWDANFNDVACPAR